MRNNIFTHTFSHFHSLANKSSQLDMSLGGKGAGKVGGKEGGMRSLNAQVGVLYHTICLCARATGGAVIYFPNIIALYTFHTLK